jgi:hypothetical protein
LSKSNGLAPAPLGNRRAVTHTAYATFTPADLEAVRELEDEIRAICPIDSASVEPAISVLASLLWRRDGLVAYLAEHGFTRGRADRATLSPALEALDRIEKAIVDTSRQLAMLPREAAALGLQLKQLRSSDRFDASRLTRDEQTELDRLLNKARVNDA